MRLSNVFSRRRTRGECAALLSLLATIILVLFAFQSQRANASSNVVFTIEGFHDGANCSEIIGWAWDSNQPNTPISVDIFSDDVPILTVSANQFRQDLLDAGKGNGFHGFNVATPNSLKDGQTHSIRVRVSSSGFDLFNTPRAINCASYEGFHDIADCNVIAGWAWNSDQPNTPISVDVYIDNNNFASVRAPANQFRQDLLNAGKGNGFHGFSFATPAFLKNGQPHSIRVKFADTAIDLGFTPKSITCSATPEPNYEGFHDIANCSVIAGWAWDSTQPNTPISVDIYSGNMLIATVAANQFRQDLLNAGKGNGVHGFSFATPPSLNDGQQHVIAVGVHATKFGLGNTPKTINCAVNSFEGFHDGADCAQIVGWAWDANQPNTPINVDIFSDNVLIATVPANQFRQDLLNAGKGNGVHGFSFATPMALKDGLPHSIRVRIAGTAIDLGNTPKSITCP